MRRGKAAPLAAPCAVLLLGLAGCGVSGDTLKPWWMRDAAEEGLPAVSGDFGEEPEVDFGEEAPPEEALSLVAIEGSDSGDLIQASDVVISEIASYSWNGPGDFEEQTSTYETEAPMALEIAPDDQQLNDCLGDVTAGSRVVCSFPAPEQDPMMGETGDIPTTIVVFDIEEHFPVGAVVEAEQTEEGGGDLPTVPDPGPAMPEIEIPDSDPPDDLEVVVLAEGDGPEVEAEQQVVLQYTGVRWDDGEVFDSTWDPEGRDGAPIAQFQIGVGGLIEGWDEGMVGENVGSRIMLVIPEDMAYGEDAEETGSPAGTLVFVVDILAAVDPQPVPEPEEGLEDPALEDLEEEAPEEEDDSEDSGDEDAEDDDS